MFSFGRPSISTGGRHVCQLSRNCSVARFVGQTISGFGCSGCCKLAAAALRRARSGWERQMVQEITPGGSTGDDVDAAGWRLRLFTTSYESLVAPLLCDRGNCGFSGALTSRVRRQMSHISCCINAFHRSGHVLTVLFNQVCAVQEAERAVQDTKLFSPKEESHRLSKLKTKCTKFDVGWHSAPDRIRGAYSLSQDVLSGFLWAYLQDTEGREREDMVRDERKAKGE